MVRLVLLFLALLSPAAMDLPGCPSPVPGCQTVPRETCEACIGLACRPITCAEFARYDAYAETWWGKQIRPVVTDGGVQ